MFIPDPIRQPVLFCARPGCKACDGAGSRDRTGVDLCRATPHAHSSQESFPGGPEPG